VILEIIKPFGDYTYLAVDSLRGDIDTTPYTLGLPGLIEFIPERSRVRNEMIFVEGKGSPQLRTLVEAFFQNLTVDAVIKSHLRGSSPQRYPYLAF
jgi:hypothetical protein